MRKIPAKYMTQIDDTRQAVVERESIDADKAAAEFMFLGLRMTEGIRADTFRQRFGKPRGEFYPQIDTWIEGELLEENGGFSVLPPKGSCSPIRSSCISCSRRVKVAESTISDHLRESLGG